MTFGEKIQKLRKEAGLSQEELSEQLGVSRQAISKWERDKGYPETEKIIQMSRMFHVTLDYLLNEDHIHTEDHIYAKDHMHADETDMKKDLYVTCEMAGGFLLYQKIRFLKIAAAAGIMTAGLSFSYMGGDSAMLLFILTLIVGIVLLCSVRLTDNPYREIWNAPLLMDKDVKEELSAVYMKAKKKMHFLCLTGVALIASGFLFFPLLVTVEPALDDVVLALGMVVAGAGIFLCVYMAGKIRAYRLLVMNEMYQRKRRRE